MRRPLRSCALLAWSRQRERVSSTVYCPLKDPDMMISGPAPAVDARVLSRPLESPGPHEQYARAITGRRSDPDDRGRWRCAS